jgi:hypothetical protein
MQKMEKGAPPQFMSTHPSVGAVGDGMKVLCANMLFQSYNRMEAIQGW